MGVVRPPQHISFFFFFSLDFFVQIKYVMEAFWKKKKRVKVVELPQFESLEGLSVMFKTLEVKVKMGGQLGGGGKCNFPFFFFWGSCI
jgi:hypothetical protein